MSPGFRQNWSRSYFKGACTISIEIVRKEDVRFPIGLNQIKTDGNGNVF
jgi:hypothetical protein